MAHRRRTAKKKLLRRRRMALPAVLGAFLALAYVAGRFLGGLAPLPGLPGSYPPDDPDAPRYTGAAPFVVAVDAGHGGAAVGAAGAVVEYEMTWQTAEALYALLEADPNFTPVRTRQSIDRNPSPADRAEAANAAGAQLLVSIHGNGATDSAVRGFECYPVPPGRARHSQSEAFARLLAAEFAAAGQTLRGAGGVRYAYYRGQTKLFADPGSHTYDTLPTFGVLERADCPALLAEQCFVTSEEDVDAFGRGEGVHTSARCFYNTICAYFDCEPMAN